MKSEKSKRTLVVFDAVGTLLSSIRSVYDIYHEIGQKFGSELPRSEVVSRFQLARQNIFKTANQTKFVHAEHPSSDVIEQRLWKQLVEFVFEEISNRDRLFDELWNFFALPENWRVFDDVKDCLSELEAAGIRYCIGSNFDSRLSAIVENRLPQFQFSQVFWSSAVGVRKPDKQFYQSIQDKHREIDEFVMVGDDPINDFEAPRFFGWHSIFLDRANTDDSLQPRVSSLSSFKETVTKILES